MDLINTLPIGSLGAGSILGLVILLVLRGNLIPRSIYQERMADKDEQIKEYREALDRERVRGDIQVRQIDTLMEVANTAEHVLNSLPTGKVEVHE